MTKKLLAVASLAVVAVLAGCGTHTDETLTGDLMTGELVEVSEELTGEAMTGELVVEDTNAMAEETTGDLTVEVPAE